MASAHAPRPRAIVSPHEKLIVIGLAVALAVQLAFAIVRDGLTYDELVYIARGYSHLVQGDFRLNAGHPPIAKLLIALPLVPLGLNIPDLRPDDHVWNWSYRFVHEANDASRIIWRARIPSVLLTLALAFVLWAWSRAAYGPVAGVAALFMTTFHPSLLAHGHLATTDLPAALSILVASWAFWLWLRRPGFPRALCVGLAMGIAVATRLTGWLLPPIFILVGAWEWHRRPQDVPGWRQWVALCAALLIMVPVVIWSSYGWRFAPWPGVSSAPVAGPEAGTAERIIVAARKARALPDSYLMDVAKLVGLQQGKHAPTYLLGRWSADGWPHYYLVAFAVKSTPGFLLACAVTALVALRRRQDGKSVAAHWVVPAAVIVLVASALRFQIGERYVLSAYPFLILLVASAAPHLARTRVGRVALTAIAVLHAVPTVLTAPAGYIPYFNALAGGEAGGHRFFLDSNLDWGQDLPRLKRWMQSHGVEKIQLAYFGRDDPGRYQIRHKDLPGANICDEGPPQHPFRGVVVVSPNALFSARPAEEHYAQLARRLPDARVGVFFVYRLGDEGAAR